MAKIVNRKFHRRQAKVLQIRLSGRQRRFLLRYMGLECAARCAEAEAMRETSKARAMAKLYLASRFREMEQRLERMLRAADHGTLIYE
jgi:hypothetical protein